MASSRCAPVRCPRPGQRQLRLQRRERGVNPVDYLADVLMAGRRIRRRASTSSCRTGSHRGPSRRPEGAAGGEHGHERGGEHDGRAAGMDRDVNTGMLGRLQHVPSTGSGGRGDSARAGCVEADRQCLSETAPVLQDRGFLPEAERPLRLFLRLARALDRLSGVLDMLADLEVLRCGPRDCKQLAPCTEGAHGVQCSQSRHSHAMNVNREWPDPCS